MKNDNFEKKILRVQEIVDLLEEGELPITEMIELYEEAMKLSIECRQFLSEAEMKVESISKEYFSPAQKEEFKSSDEIF